MKKTVGFLLLIVVAWRTALFGWGVVSQSLLTYNPSFPYAYTLLPSYGLPIWVYSWANFDGVHYLTIADRGYQAADLIQAFFPVYPFVLRAFSTVIGNTITAGLILSVVTLTGCVVLLWLIARHHFSSKVAWIAVCSLLLFPSSFFLAALYSESIFLLTVLATFYFAQKKQWFLAGCTAAIASGTRIVGVLLVPALIVELAELHAPLDSWSWNTFKTFLSRYKKEILFCILGVSGLVSYMIYLYTFYGDALYFWHVQSEFGGGREESIVLLPQVVWRYLKIIFTVPLGREWVIYLQEMFFGIVPLIALVVGWFKSQTIRTSWLIFSTSALIIPTLTGTFSSMPRYTLVAFPLFLLLALKIQKSKLWYAVIAASAILLLFNVVLFVQGYWVA